ncbi:hypothetical protein VZT92_021297 [Zoarces viviparus]|uniref:Uncharacterized protein n=1 Tax=Zoarces viviparus TaxID=48416 RepID=A0AAW1EIM1_ZOAVI
MRRPGDGERWRCSSAGRLSGGDVLLAGSWGPWEAQERDEGPAMESPELVAVAPRDTGLLRLGREPPDRVEEVAAWPVSPARCCSLSLLARAWASRLPARSSASTMTSDIS